MKKSAVIASVVAFGLICGAVGAGAATGIQQIKAALNYNLKFKVDGESWTPKDGNGNTMAPIVFNGSTYLPARAMSEALGAEIALNGNTISINTGASGIPYNDGDTSGNTTTGNSGGSSEGTSETSGGAAKTNGMTVETAIPLGQSLTFTDNYSYDGRSTSDTYTITVKGVKSISRDQIAAYGFKKPEQNSDVEYKLVSVKVELKNGKVITNGYLDSTYVSNIMPEIWGSKIENGPGGIIGGTDYGFDGSLQDAVEDAAGSKTLNDGQSGSYTATGYVILPVQTGETNYLVFQLQDPEIDSDKSFKFFSLQ